MRIAILTNSYPPDGRGGTERIAYLQASGLRERGHEIQIWAPMSGSGYEANIVRFKSRFNEIGSLNPVSRLVWHLLEDIGMNHEAVDSIAEWKPDVLITHNLTGCGIKTPGAIVERLGIPWMHTLHDVQLTDPSGQIRLADSDRGRLWRGFWSWVRCSRLGTPDVLVSPTNWLLAWHKNYGFKGGREIVIPNPVQLGLQKNRQFQKPYTLLYVGRLTRDKGFDVYFDLVSKLNHDLVRKFVVIGDGALREEADRVEYLGVQSPEETRRAIASADLLVAPSAILENQQTILLEAMAEGTPVVATDVGGTRETLTGTGCPVAIAREIPRTTLQLLEHPDHMKQISGSMQDVAQKHSERNYFDSLSSILTGLRKS